MNATREVLDALARRHRYPRNGDTPAWIYLEELRVGTGWRPIQVGGDPFSAEQRIDAYALHTWPSQNLLRIAYEVKVSRSDLTRELGAPWKREAAMALSNEFYFVVNDDVTVEEDEIPEDCGLMRHRDGMIRTILNAPRRTIEAPPRRFLLSIARHLYKMTE